MEGSSIDQNGRSEVDCKSLMETINNNMSPVTDLTFNLKSLSTSMAGTPSRRISWSNPFPSGCDTRRILSELSPSVDSPTFQNIICKTKPKWPKVSRKVLPSNSDDEKENAAPKSFTHSQQIPIKYESCSLFGDSSQDSGYSGLSEKLSQDSDIFPTPRPKVRSSIFADDEEDGFENIFQMDDDQDLVAMPDNMESLLTKPLFGGIKKKYIPTTTGKKGKPPIRRCLSMEMDCDSNSLPAMPEEAGHTNATSVPSCISPYEESMDLELPNKCPFKRPGPPNNYFSLQNKRRKSSPTVEFESECVENSVLYQRSHSETSATIMQAIQKADLQPELIGDCSRSYALPLVKGRHQDLKSITPDTLVQVLKGDFSHQIENYTLVDCRYPYEFEGGHIQGAKNIYTKEEILETFLKEPSSSPSKSVIIFHCEFSSERAPNLCRFLRNKDREINEVNYPQLNHPEMYVLEGGYKAFFECFKEYCEPQEYKPMNHKDHGFELRHFRAKSKSWGADSKGRYKLRTGSMHQVL